MIMIFTALYCEAQPLIQHYHLIKNNNINKFQVFQNEDILLAVTNTGSMNAAIAVTYLCTLYPPALSDFLINIGVCGAFDENISVGSIFLCNKITDDPVKRSFYPDVIFKHPFAESDIMTCSTVLHDPRLYMEEQRSAKLFDMEASGIYQAAAYFVQPHQTAFLKIVSDYGKDNKLDPGKVTELVEKNREKMIAWLNLLRQMKRSDKPAFNPEEESYIKELAANLHCSVTMEHKLRQQLYYYKLTHGSFIEAVADFCLQNQLSCKTKAEGKIYFEQFRSKLI